ncbi:methyl-accepting chemotaxis protein [Ramlibacter sp. 2FC]|uniref:methyl-accepting chemotaxis protein n=1 Tax=Ramlibacter sp. 2FC TaxID=2502188 RepID=UPI0010F8FCEC|nr:methyl-accepting chemotaxis protein [Ramlibacter sp. 2FC]
MNWLLNLSTRGKLVFGFGLMLAFLLGVIGSAYWGMGSMLASERALYEDDYRNVRDMAGLRTQFNQIRVLMLEAQLMKSRSDQEPLLRQATEGSKQIDQALRGLQERTRDDPGLSSRLTELKSVWDAFAQTKDAEIIPLILAGKLAEAQQLAVGVQQGRAKQIRALDEELVRLVEEKMRLAVAHSEAQALQTLRIVGLCGAVALAAGLTLVILFSRMIAAPLRDIAARASRIADGEIVVQASTAQRTDEIGQLEERFNQMAISLRDKAAVAQGIAGGDLSMQVQVRSGQDALGNAFSTMLDNLRKMTHEIHEGVNVLASSSNEILATTSQVAAGAAQTAAAVSQTTVTVEEVKQTAQLSSQKARHVSDSAQRAAQVSQGGRQAVEDAIAGMHRIQEQMASIADSVVRLSEQGQAIGEIIATVNELAERSNLLAVNAAIEAARAGEEGKGFAVVAQEVRSLAEQSKQATAQVRTILGDIQKATSAAVLATEQGHKAVAAGVQQSADAAQAIHLLAESIDEAARAATQIAASSQQQMVGMDQVGQAMESIKQASLQNAAGTRQAETAAQGLHELGARLRQQVALYRL